MATDQEGELRTRLSALLKEIADLIEGDLVRENTLGQDFNFRDTEPYFSRIRTLVARLGADDLALAGFDRLNILVGAANTLRDQLNNIKAFSPKQVSNPANQRDSLAQQVRGGYDGLLVAAGPVLAVGASRSGALDALAEQGQRQLDELRALLASATTETQKAQAEVQALLAGVRSAAAQTGVTKHAALFANEADGQSRAGRWWLIATILLAVLTLGFAGATLFVAFPLPLNATVTEAVQLALGKVLVFTVLGSATIWAGRTYRAHQHNLVVNRHRQNALSTFETFASAAGDDAQTKNSVLLRATEAIFLPQPSGYVPHEPETGTGTGQILEIFRQVGGPRP